MFDIVEQDTFHRIALTPQVIVRPLDDETVRASRPEPLQSVESLLATQILQFEKLCGFHEVPSQ